MSDCTSCDHSLDSGQCLKGNHQTFTPVQTVKPALVKSDLVYQSLNTDCPDFVLGDSAKVREIKFIIHSGVVKCPKCENSVSFKAHSSPLGEDCCNVWVECGVCGFDPTADNTSLRFKDIFCGTDAENCFMALKCWNDVITELYRGDDQ